MTVAAQRQGTATRAIWYPEIDGEGTDPGTPVGVVLPLVERAGFGPSQNMIDAPVFDGTMLPGDVIPGLITAQGALPLGLEFTTIGHLLYSLFGKSDGYLRPATPGFLHEFFVPTVFGANAGSGQVQYEFGPATIQYLRYRYGRVNSIGLEMSPEGQAKASVDLMGSGDEAQTDLAGQKTENGDAAAASFNGKLLAEDVWIAGLVTAFGINFNANLSRQDSVLNSGIAAAINFGKLTFGGNLELMMQKGGSTIASDLAFYNKAVNQTRTKIECIWSDLPPAQATKWLRVVITRALFGRAVPAPGGPNGVVLRQSFKAPNDSSAKTKAELFGSVLGPYLIDATNNKLSVKKDGAAGVVITLTQGAARTAAQIAAEIDAGLTRVDSQEVMGRLMIRPATAGAASCVAIDTAGANSAHTTLGMGATVRTGKDNCPILVQLYNAKNADYT